jgi:hypothetical protein
VREASRRALRELRNSSVASPNPAKASATTDEMRAAAIAAQNATVAAIAKGKSNLPI